MLGKLFGGKLSTDTLPQIYGRENLLLWIVFEAYGQAFIHTVRTSGEKFISSLQCVAKKDKSKRVPELGGRELTESPDVLTAYTMAGPLKHVF